MVVAFTMLACSGFVWADFSQAIARSLRPVSLLSLRFAATVPQSFDYTCGASSIATILTYYWGRRTTEADALTALKHRYTTEEIARRRQTGLTFDDLIFVAHALGFEAEGARIALRELPNLDGPVIVHLVTPSFEHFAVLRGVGDGVYYLADPVVGARTVSAHRFAEEFSGNILAIMKPGAELPHHSRLTDIHDGISVRRSLDHPINRPASTSHRLF